MRGFRSGEVKISGCSSGGATGLEDMMASISRVRVCLAVVGVAPTRELAPVN